MNFELNFAERRVLGTLVEKAFTTPQQCPLTMNSLVNGCNQKSCRDPVSNLDEEQIYDTLESLRGMGLTTLVRSSGSQVDRYRQRLAETLELSPQETAVVAELLLRGAQSAGELRQRASRMAQIETLRDMEDVIQALSEREQPLVTRASPPGRSRGVMYDHLLYPEGEGSNTPVESPAADAVPQAAPVPQTAPAASVPMPDGPAEETPGLHDEIIELRTELSTLRSDLDALRTQIERLETVLTSLSG